MIQNIKDYFACKQFGPFRFFVHGLIEYTRGERAYHFIILNPKDWFWGRYQDDGCFLDGYGGSPFFSVFWQ